MRISSQRVRWLFTIEIRAVQCHASRRYLQWNEWMKIEWNKLSKRNDLNDPDDAAIWVLDRHAQNRLMAEVAVDVNRRIEAAVLVSVGDIYRLPAREIQILCSIPMGLLSQFFCRSSTSDCHHLFSHCFTRPPSPFSLFLPSFPRPSVSENSFGILVGFFRIGKEFLFQWIIQEPLPDSMGNLIRGLTRYSSMRLISLKFLKDYFDILPRVKII